MIFGLVWGMKPNEVSRNKGITKCGMEGDMTPISLGGKRNNDNDNVF